MLQDSFLKFSQNVATLGKNADSYKRAWFDNVCKMGRSSFQTPDTIYELFKSNPEIDGEQIEKMAKAMQPDPFYLKSQGLFAKFDKAHS